jgi:hypothetical protein
LTSAVHFKPEKLKCQKFQPKNPLKIPEEADTGILIPFVWLIEYGEEACALSPSLFAN